MLLHRLYTGIIWCWKVCSVLLCYIKALLAPYRCLVWPKGCPSVYHHKPFFEEFLFTVPMASKGRYLFPGTHNAGKVFWLTWQSENRPKMTIVFSKTRSVETDFLVTECEVGSVQCKKYRKPTFSSILHTPTLCVLDHIEVIICCTTKCCWQLVWSHTLSIATANSFFYSSHATFLT